MATLKERLAAAKAKTPPVYTTSGGRRYAKGIRIRPSDPETAPAASPERPEPRELGRTQGEDIPFSTAPESDPAKSWHEVRTALDTDLGIWIEGEHAWLAIKSRDSDHPGLILLHRLPLIPNPRDGEPY